MEVVLYLANWPFYVRLYFKRGSIGMANVIRINLTHAGSTRGHECEFMTRVPAELRQPKVKSILLTIVLVVSIAGVGDSM